MSISEIKELRHSGKLEEALKMATEALEAEPENIWNKRGAAWVYYDFLKKSTQPELFDSFKENLNKIKDLRLPDNEKMVFDSCAWQIGKMIFAFQNKASVDYAKQNEILDIIQDYHFTKPSEAYSFIFKAFHKGYHNWSNYLSFADWWNLENLRPEDYLKEEYEGNKIMSIAEQAFIAYSKKLLEGEPLDSFGHQRVLDKEKIEAFLPKLNALIEKHPEYQYPPYFKAKLLLALGNDENVLSAFLPFARQKRNDFWVWELIGEIFSDKKDKGFIKIWVNDELKVDAKGITAAGPVGKGHYIKAGLYQTGITRYLRVIGESTDWKKGQEAGKFPTQIIYMDNIFKANSEEKLEELIKKAS